MIKLIDVVDTSYPIYISVPEHNKSAGQYTYEMYNAEKHKDYLYRNVDSLDYTMQGVVVYLV